MPNAIYVALQTDPDAALVLSVILMLVSVAVLALLRERWFDAGRAGRRARVSEPYLDAHVVVRRPGHTLDVHLTRGARATWSP